MPAEETRSRPPPDDASNDSDWRAWIECRLEQYNAEERLDPLLNPVRRLASDLASLLEDGNLELTALFGVAKHISDRAFEFRAKEFAVQKDGDRLIASDNIDALIDRVAENGFKEYSRVFSQTHCGVVLTAHPTFAMSSALRAVLVSYPHSESEDKLRKWRDTLKGVEHAPDSSISLFDEHDHALRAIAKCQISINALHRKILEKARDAFPEQWTALVPAPVSLATWVGYDLDGRTDIPWWRTISFRLSEKAVQLDRYASMLAAIGNGGPNIEGKKIVAALLAAAEFSAEQAAQFANDLTAPEAVVDAANCVTRADPRRLTSLTKIRQTLTAMINASENDRTRMDLCVLRAGMDAFGLGVARIHLRVNAAQVRSALRAEFGLNPDTELMERSVLPLAADKVSRARKRSVDFGAVFLEQMTAKRQFMLCAQILKHIDEDSPIRFLIAECEAPATVMGAVYLARLYGVDKKLDISPLFETPTAIEGGGRFLQRLLAEPEYQSYVKERGRVSIQIGFSDAGRFMGQVAAALAIERLQILFANAIQDAGVTDVEALIFNTHGESMGRGAHPFSSQDRDNHLTTPWVRSRFRKNQIHLNTECSFQGGDGFLHLETQPLCDNTVFSNFTRACVVHDADRSDQFYLDINYSWDFYRALKSWQEALYEDADYGEVLGPGPQNFLFKTGSRQVKRHSPSENISGPRSMRAIPHNAILQQFAIPANVAGGIGTAIGREDDRFVEHANASPRMCEILTMAGRALELTDLSIFRSYADTLDPAHWIARGKSSRKRKWSTAHLSIAACLKRQSLHNAFERLANHLETDILSFQEVETRLDTNQSPSYVFSQTDMLRILHAIRQSLIIHALSLVGCLPSFSKRHDIGPRDLIDVALQWRFGEVEKLIGEIFPLQQGDPTAFSNIEERNSEQSAEIGGYPDVHKNIKDPIEKIDAGIKRIGLGIAHFYKAYG